MGAYARERGHERIAELAGRGLDLVTFWGEATEVIAPLVPNYMGPCWFTLDPASLLITSHFNPYMPALPHEALAMEYYEDDVNKLADVVRSASGVSTLHEATGGDPTSSPRWRANIQLGGDQELVLGLRTASGEAWGGLGVYREAGAPMFDREDVAFLRAVAPWLAEGARRALLLGEALDPEGPHAPGLLVLTSEWEIESATPGVERWLSDLSGGDRETGAAPVRRAGGRRTGPAVGGGP